MAEELKYSAPVEALLPAKQLVSNDLHEILKMGRRRTQKLLNAMVADGDLLSSPEPPDDSILAFSKQSRIDPDVFLAVWRLGNWLVTSAASIELERLISDFCEVGFVRTEANND